MHPGDVGLVVAAGDPTSTSWAVILNYGAVGAMAVLLALFAYGAYKRERDRADFMFDLLQKTNERISERFADTLKETKDALVAANDYLHDLARPRR